MYKWHTPGSSGKKQGPTKRSTPSSLSRARPLSLSVSLSLYLSPSPPSFLATPTAIMLPEHWAPLSFYCCAFLSAYERSIKKLVSYSLRGKICHNEMMSSLEVHGKSNRGILMTVMSGLHMYQPDYILTPSLFDLHMLIVFV